MFGERRKIVISDKLNRSFTWDDVARWVESGLITPEQAGGIRQEIETQSPVPAAMRAEEGAQKKQGLNLVTIACYFGAFMILLAYTLFMGLHWEKMGYANQFMVTLASMLVVGLTGYYLRRAGLTLAGGLLIFAATGIMPLLAYTLAQALGIWPKLPEYGQPGYDAFYETIRPYWVYLEVVSLALAVAVVWLIRFPPVSLLIAFWSWYLSMDLARWVAGAPVAGYNDLEQTVSICVAVAMLAAGVLLQYRTEQDYSRWLYLFGHVALLANLGALAYRKEGPVALVFLGVYVGIVLASVWLQRPVFLVFGALGCYSYIGYLAFRIFPGAGEFPIALAITGFTIVLTAVGFQKLARGWLESHLHRSGVGPAQHEEVPGAA
jgi:hypothetical protein